MTFFIYLQTKYRGSIYHLSFPSLGYIYYPLPQFMTGKKPVEKVAKGLNALVDEFTSSVKELVNAGEETVVHLAVGGGRVISALIDATGEVTKVTVETTSNVVGAVGGGIVRAVKKGENPEKKEEKEEGEKE